jgi:GDPmannose 4,6-dehydratase
MSKIFISGITGQDGSYLTEYLLSLGHEIHGIVRRNSVAENQTGRIGNLRDKITLHYGDMTDYTSLENALKVATPDYVFHLAAQSQVRVSFDIPEYTLEVNAMGAFKLFEACRKVCPSAHIYNAGSSEMFGLSVDVDKYQREITPMNPTSPYGISKVMAFNLTSHYRRAYGMYFANGILFNHTSPRRSTAFVTQKVVRGVISIVNGLSDKLELGDLDTYRDWGHAKDYVEAMWKIVNHSESTDFVIATGITHSVREMCIFVFNYFGLDYKKYVVQNPRLMRAEELPYLRGDSSKAQKLLGWKPKYTFETLLREMIYFEKMK